MEVMGEDLIESEVNVDVSLRNTNNEEVKLNQGNYVAFQASDLRTYLKTHNGEKSNMQPM